MKLSDAIRLGAMVRPQAFGDSDHDGGSCALRAAAEAVGIRNTSLGWFNYTAMRERWPFLKDAAVCPVARCPRELDDFTVMIWHLNDTHRWTREQIADWVATVEPAETTSAAHGPVDVRGTTDVDQPVLSLREA